MLEESPFAFVLLRDTEVSFGSISAKGKFSEDRNYSRRCDGCTREMTGKRIRNFHEEKIRLTRCQNAKCQVHFFCSTKCQQKHSRHLRNEW